jgi:phytoene/squalene synthetase
VTSGKREIVEIKSDERRNIMKKLGICLLVLGGLLLLVNPVMAQEGLVESVLTGCKTELEKYCSNVTPGEGRVLACLYAYEDKLSGRCEYALYDAAVQLERAVAALSYVVNECSSDLKQYCTGVAAGEGRLLQCLEKNDAQVSQRCKQARKDVGLK